jgi:hypothetical protein
MKADPSLSLQKIDDVANKLSLQGINITTANTEGSDSFNSVNNWFIQSKADADGFDRILGQAGISDGLCRVTGKDTKQKKVQKHDKDNGQQSPADFFEHVFVHLYLCCIVSVLFGASPLPMSP